MFSVGMLGVRLCMGEHWPRAQEEPSALLQWQERAVWPGSSLVTSGVGLHQQKFAQTSVRAGGAMAVAICPIPDPWFTEAVGETPRGLESPWLQLRDIAAFPSLEHSWSWVGSQH